ncbi:MAG: hypothetical protein HYS25_03700 [Ignavibacteriales bacterium]|nr:hypothetical protein [Ignavibacteriales bacterium]
MNKIIEEVFSVSKNIRYVAVYLNGVLESKQRNDLNSASSSESDKYEELIVNPTMLKLVTQRGNIDCGGAQYVIVRYGNFYQLVYHVKGGHISVSIELDPDLLKLVEEIKNIVDKKVN